MVLLPVILLSSYTCGWQDATALAGSAPVPSPEPCSVPSTRSQRDPARRGASGGAGAQPGCCYLMGPLLLRSPPSRAETAGTNETPILRA